MRASFFSVLQEYFKKDSSLYILTGDLGYKLFDDFKHCCPQRMYDVGIAEANMVSIAAGLALSGNQAYCYSIVPFLIMRAYEQIRVDIDYHDLNVKLVGVGGGFTYGFEGFTHFGLEDIALMCSLQNMAVVVPADIAEAISLAKASYEYEGPMYIRLGRAGEPAIHEKKPYFKIGRPIVMQEGREIAIFAVGSMVYIGKKVAEVLRRKGFVPTLIDMHTLKPLDKKFIRQYAGRHEVIVTLEEHSVYGGLGDLVGGVLLEERYRGRFKKIGIPEKVANCVGDADYLRERHGLGVSSIVKNILDIISF